MPRLLVVDDDPDILRVVRFYLNKLHYKVLVASSAKEAMRLLKENQDVELVLSDVMMPEMSGLDLLKTLRQSDEWGDLPVILISAEAESSKKVVGLNLGADDFITKPFNFDELMARVGNHLRLRRLQKQLMHANLLLTQQNERMTENLEAARRAQMALLPDQFPESEHTRFGFRYLPVQRVGGDFFDVVPLDSGRKLGMFVADVCGHGIAAAFVTAMTKISFRNACFLSTNPADVLSSMNRELSHTLKGSYVTAFYAVYDTQSHTLAYAGGGHPPLFLWHTASQSVEVLASQETFLGFFETLAFKSDQVEIATGDRILLYTDGLYEAHNTEDSDFGLERVKGLIAEHSKGTVEALLDVLVARVTEFVGGRALEDDITLVGLDVVQ